MAHLIWPGHSLQALQTADGWDFASLDGALVAGLKKIRSKAAGHRPSAIAIYGERLAALRGIKLCGLNVGFIYIDLPRTQAFQAKRPGHAVSTWLSLLRGVLQDSVDALAKGGSLAVQIDDAGGAYARQVLDDVCGVRARTAVILWQKKYSAQPDLLGRVDDAHDYIFVYTPGMPTRRQETVCWWPWSLAGKSEDATREIQQLHKAKIIRHEPPKTGKPLKLLSKLIDEFAPRVGSFVEVFSETGFAATAALQSGRTATLLVGSSDADKQAFERFSLPRLEHAVPERPLTVELLSTSFVAPSGEVAPFEGSIRLMPEVAPLSHEISWRPLVVDSKVPHPEVRGVPSMHCCGTISQSLAAACNVLTGKAALVVLSVKEVALSELRFRVDRAIALLRPDGILVLQADTNTFAEHRLRVEEWLGPDQYAGSIVVSDGTIYLLFHATPGLPRSKLGLPASRTYVDDGHPDGPWRDPKFKGARSPSDPYPVRVPPYRWQCHGRVPAGLFRINPHTGLLWARRLEECGTFDLDITVTDAVGENSTAKLRLVVQQGGVPQLESTVWFLDAKTLPHGGRLRIATTSLPPGIYGHEYCAMLKASGGTPYDLVLLPGSRLGDGAFNRYWECSRSTLVTAILKDRARFGTRGESRPSRLKFQREEELSEKASKTVELGWWEEATVAGNAAMRRLLQLFSEPEDLVVAITEDVIRPLTCASDLNRRVLTFSKEPVAAAVCQMRSSDPLVEQHAGTIELKYDHARFKEGVAWMEGFLPTNISPIRTVLPSAAIARLAGISPCEKNACVILDQDEWPTPALCADVTQTLTPYFERIVIYHYRGRAPLRSPGLCFRRIPFDLRRGGV